VGLIPHLDLQGHWTSPDLFRLTREESVSNK